MHSGWYLQQFLKLDYYLNSNDDVLIIDGDTVLSEALFLASLRNDTLFYNSENVQQYSKLLCSFSFLNYGSSKSYICNFGAFELSCKDFYPKDINGFLSEAADLVLKSQMQERRRYSSCDFSEYQLNGDFRRQRGKLLKRVKMFRRADLLMGAQSEYSLAFINKLFSRYECISFEIDHKSSALRRWMARVYFWLGIAW